jgi:1-deoxy-D-xylulose-5-phosphate reductoisomerase
MKRKVCILGSTGSIGVQALDVIREHADKFEVSVLTGYRNAELLIQQAREFKPHSVVIADKSLYKTIKDALFGEDIQVYAGDEAIEQVAAYEQTDIVLTALVGAAGLKPTLKALEAGKPIALANKETLVVAGEIVTKLAYEKGVPILPVDSEHSAIFQCLSGESHNKIEKIVLTASGGPFRARSRESLADVNREQALKHPNWSMGAKITIDSATLMNKGLEVIEAKWLFGLHPQQIEVIVHPQSIIHSMVQFEDGSMIAQMGLPDMKLPIQYALAYPHRIKNSFPRFDFRKYPQLTFEMADMETFQYLGLAFDALGRGGNACCILNAANEISVQAFLNNQIGFLQIPEHIEEALSNIPYIHQPNIQQLLQTDTETRAFVHEQIQKKINN